MDGYIHSIRLDNDRCTGCTNCMKRCPTQAIRVRDGKAKIISERCIDCGECIRICPYHAKFSFTNTFDTISSYKYKVVIPDPAFYGQFKSVEETNKALSALKNIGFDYVFEVDGAIRDITQTLKKMIRDNEGKPFISSFCPAVVRLIQIRFPNLLNNIVKLESPAEITARRAKEQLCTLNACDMKDIGVFYITPCAAGVTEAIAPIGGKEAHIDAVISMKEVYIRIMALLNKTEIDFVSTMAKNSLRWGHIGGEVIAIENDNSLPVDGIDNVISILEDVENDKLKDVDYLELAACNCGCVGGPLTAENPYIAKNNIRKIAAAFEDVDLNKQKIEDFTWSKIPDHIPALKLDSDVRSAMQKMREMNELLKELPGLDCGSCGAPTCKALAEDVVKGSAELTFCKFRKNIVK